MPTVDLDALGVHREGRKGSGNHWVHFSRDDWEVIERGAGRPVEPKELRLIVLGLFSGKVKVTKA
jgi:hypothetical protein